MSRKKWTPKTEVTADVLQLRVKRKWQIALRRYLLEGNKSSFYAPYFGLPIEKFRRWIELQFDENLSWDNFSKAWQLDHLVSVAYFNHELEDDLRLCWNFTNTRVAEVAGGDQKRNRIDLITAKKHFETLYEQTHYIVCQQMLEKITSLVSLQRSNNQVLSDFILQNMEFLQSTASFTSDDFERLNKGTTVKSLVFEKEFLKRHSS